MLASSTAIAIALSAGAARAQQASPQGTSPAAVPIDPAAQGPSPAAGQPAIPGQPAARGQVEEIVVTAQKRAENIQDVPLSIIAVSGQRLADANVGDPIALQKLVPSLNITSVTFGSGAVIRIRGFGSAGNTAIDPDVAAYVDGTVIPRPGAALNSFLDVSSVEVLNGPQGTLFGRNAAMGAISVNTNAPSTAKTAVNMTVEGATHSTYSALAVANLPVSDTFALRFAGKAAHSGGIYHNDLDGRDYGRSNSYLGRLSAKWNITPSLGWTVRADYSKTRGDGVIANAVDVSTATAAQLTALNTFVINNGGTPPVEKNPPSFHFNQLFGSPYLHDKQYGFSSDLSFAVAPKLTLRLLDSYRKWTDDQLTGDTIATSISLLSILENISSRSQSHELQLISPKGAFLNSKLGITAGFYYFQEDYNLNNSFNLGSKFCPIILAASPPAVAACQAAPQTRAGYNLFGQDADSYAGYVQGNYQILSNLEVDLGVRRTWDKKTGSYNAFTPNGTALNRSLVVPESTALRFKDSKWSYRGTLSWHLADRTMAFATYSTGYKSGGFNASAAAVVLGSTNRTFNSETVKDIEAGVKSVLADGKVLLNVTLFNTTLNNFQDRSYNGLFFLVRNSGKVRSRGVDVDGQVRPGSNVSLTFSATYLDSIYKTDTGAPGLEGCTGIATGSCSTVQDLSGRTLGYAPKFRANGGIEYKYPLANGYTIAVSPSGHYSSSFYTVNTLNPQSKLPSFFTADFRIGVSAPDSRWQIDIFGTNVFAKHYFVALNPQTLGAIIPGVNDRTTGATIFRGILGDPARFGARLSAKF